MSWITVKLLGWISGGLLLVSLGLGTALALTHASLQVARSDLSTLQAQHTATIAAANLAAQERAREKEQQQALALAQAAEQYEKGKRDAEAEQARVVAELQSGARRLRDHWAGCETGRLSQAAASAAELDAAEQRRRESAGRIVRACRECDEQVAGLQTALRACLVR